MCFVCFTFQGRHRSNNMQTVLTGSSKFVIAVVREHGPEQTQTILIPRVKENR